MPHSIIRRILTVLALAVASATAVLAQSTTTFQVPVNTYTSDWQIAQQVGASEGKLIVVTVDQPERRETCRIHSFTRDKLVCFRAFAAPRTYLPKQVAALIIPGSVVRFRIPLWIGSNAGLGASIWATVVLAAACPACAVGTGIAALVFFAFAGALVYGDDQPDRLLYLAPGHHLGGNVGYVQPSL